MLKLEEDNSLITSYIIEHIQEEDGNPQKVQFLNLKNHRVPEIKNLNFLPNIKVIDLRNNLIVQMVGFDECLKLEQLYLCENKIQKIKRIQSLVNLRVIDLRANHIRNINDTILNLPQSVVQFKARCNLIVNVDQLFKTKLKLEVIWLDENMFLKNSKTYYSNLFNKINLPLKDFWM